MKKFRFVGAVVCLVSGCGDGASIAGPVEAKVTSPAAPRIADVTAGNKHIVVEFLPPVTDGGSAILYYELSTDNGVQWTASSKAVADNVFTATDLENGKTYALRLRAVNSIGAGVAASATGTPSRTSTGPLINGIASGDRKLTVSFSAPVDSGGLAIARYEYSVDDGVTWNQFDSATVRSPGVITELVNGNRYRVALRAVTNVGIGEASKTVDAIPMTVPSTPTLTSVTADVNSLKVLLVPPADSGGATITRFEYSIDSARTWIAVTPPLMQSFQIGGLTWQRAYTVAVRAVNAVGAGGFSKFESATPIGLALAPASIEVTGGDRELRLFFSAPADSGGVPILAYEYSLDSAVTWVTPSTRIDRHTVIRDLRNGTTYGVSMRAVTKWGKGAASPVMSAMPKAVLPVIQTVRSIAKPGESHYIPQPLDDLNPAFDLHVERALFRFRAVRGRDASTLFEKVQAAADYVANLAKHPHRHVLGMAQTDPRTWEWQDYPVKLAEIAQENQVWDGLEWVPAPGKSLLDVPAIECSFQDFILGGLVNSLGAQWMLLGITHHDAFTYYDFELGKWVYIESSYNEHYRGSSSSLADYVPLSPEELRAMSVGGDNSMLAVRHPYQPMRPEPEFYLGPYVEMFPLGFSAMMAAVNGISNGARNSLGKHLRVLPGGTSEVVFANLLAGGWELASESEDTWAAQGETFLESLEATARGHVVKLSTNLAVSSPIFERRVGSGAWVVVESESELDGLVGEIHFRARFGRFVAGEVIIRQDAK